MSAFDRRIVHTALAEDANVFTYSEGDDRALRRHLPPRGESDEEEGEETENGEPAGE